MFLGWFELGFVVCFEFVLFWLEIFDEKGQNALFLFQPDASPPKQRSAHLGEGLFTYVNPRPSSNPCLLRLGEPLCLGEPVFLAGFALTSSLSVLLSIFIKPKRML